MLLTVTLPERVEAPVTARVEARLVAPVTFRVEARLVAPVTPRVPPKEELPLAVIPPVLSMGKTVLPEEEAAGIL